MDPPKNFDVIEVNGLKSPKTRSIILGGAGKDFLKPEILGYHWLGNKAWKIYFFKWDLENWGLVDENIYVCGCVHVWVNACVCVCVWTCEYLSVCVGMCESKFMFQWM